MLLFVILVVFGTSVIFHVYSRVS